MVFVLSIVLIVSLNSITFIASTSVTYADTFIINFLNAEQNIWEKIENRLNPLQDIQQIVTKDNAYVPSYYRFGYRTEIDKYAEPFRQMERTYNQIENIFWEEEKEKRTNLTIDEIDRKYYEVNKLSDELFELISRDGFWEYGVAKMNVEDPTLETAQHTLSKLYTHIQLTFLRAYSLSQRYNFLGYYHFKGKYRDQGSTLKAEYLKKVSRIRKLAKKYAEMASNEVFGWSKLVLSYYNMRYEEITNFLQGYIVNEINLNKEGSCSTQCNDFNKITQHTCTEDTGCSQNRKCNGTLRYCRELEDVRICNTVNEQTKRYTQVKYDDGRIARRSSDCEKEVRLSSFTKWFSTCTNCFCLCDDPSNSDRYFSLREVVSDVDANKIVTGVRLLKYNRMIQLNIKEQELTPNGEAKYEDRLSFNLNWDFKGSTFQMNETGIREGIDYHTLTEESRSINLDTVVVPNGYVVTGVRFSLLNGHITLQVRGTEFDYTAGQLINKDSSIWFSNPNAVTEELILNDDVAPPLEQGFTPVSRSQNVFVKFGPTDYWSDIGQTTIPLISSEPISVKENVAISGVGLYYKSGKGFGGFITAKLVLLNIGYYIPDN